MPHADVVVIGAGLSGLVAAARLAEAGAAVTLVAKGHARTHWGSGGLDIAAPHGAVSPADGISRLAADGHPTASSVRTLHRRSPGCRIGSPPGAFPTPAPSTRRSGACPRPSAGHVGPPSCPSPKRLRSARGRRTRSSWSQASLATRTSGLARSPTASAASRSGWAPTGPPPCAASRSSWQVSEGATTSTPCTSPEGSTRA